MPSKGKQFVDYQEKIKQLSLVLPCSEIAKFLGCQTITVKQWAQNDRGTPRKQYHKKIDLLYDTVKKHADNLPDKIELTFRNGTRLEIDNPFKLDLSKVD